MGALEDGKRILLLLLFVKGIDVALGDLGAVFEMLLRSSILVIRDPCRL